MISSTPQPLAPEASAGRPKAAKQAAQTSPEQEAPTLRPMHGGRAKLAESMRNAWSVNIPEEYEPADLEKQGLWLHAGHQFRMYDRVECLHSDWIAEGFVTSYGPGVTALTLVWCVKLAARTSNADPDSMIPPGYALRQAKPGESTWNDQWLAFRKKDGVVFNRHTHCPTRADAMRELNNSAIFRVSR